MRIGLQIASFTWPGGDAAIGPTLARVSREAEAAGFYSLWVMDHFFQIQMIGSPEEPMLEGYSALSFMAGVTQKVKLGTMVTGVTYRYPGLLIKTVTTLDVLSGGRAYLGIGAAWNEEEHNGLGVPFPPLKERFERLEDALKLAHQMWSDGNDAPFDGQHAHLTRTLNSPQAVSKPHPPILIGGTGEQKTLRFVAQYGDACNIFMMGDDVVRHKLDVLRGHCATANRPYSDIEKTSLNRMLIGSGEGALSGQAIVDTIGHAAELGFDQVIIGIPNLIEPGVFDAFAAVRDQIAAIPEGGRK